MKNNIIMLICAMLLCGSIGAQKLTVDKVPAPVSSAFTSKFPAAEKASWTLHDGKYYVADFKLNNVEQSAKFNPAGGWIDSETEIKTADLPVAVKETITKQFAGYTVSEASKMENADHGIGYEVEIAKDKEIKNVILSAKGVVISQEPVKADAAKTN